MARTKKTKKKKAAPKKRAVRKKAPRRSRPGISPLAAVVVSVLVVGLVAFLLLYSKKKHEERAALPVAPKEPPTYEDLGRLSLEEKVRKADVGVFAALDELKVRASNVRFEEVRKKREGGRIWEYAQIRVGVEQGPYPVKIKGVLALRLKKDIEGLEVKVKSPAKNVAVADVMIDGFLTHRIRFSREGPPKVAPAKTIPMVAILLDDVGYDIKMAESFLELHPSISISVLPDSPFGKGIAKRAREMGREVLLHAPMEPHNGNFTRHMRHYLALGMNDAQLEKTLSEFLSEVPQAVGMNNHMGSSFTENAEKMRVVLKFIKEKGMFYVDSRTTSHSKGLLVARQIGLRSGERDVFLDHIEDAGSISIQIERLISLARQKGKCIAIVHPHKVSLEVLRLELERIEREGIMLVPVSAALG